MKTPLFNDHVPADDLLRFYAGNGKLESSIDHFSLPSGYSCPGANLCLAKAVEHADGWRLVDGPNVQFRCFSASEEARHPNVRKSRRHNFDKLLECAGRHSTIAGKTRAMAALLLCSLPSHGREIDLSIDGVPYKLVVRVHVAGDFWSQAYFDAWLTVCNSRPDILVYGYTKSLPFWCRRLDRIPQNMVLTASEGGKYDSLIGKHGLRTARVVFSKEEAAALGLAIDMTDGLAMRRGPSFALLIHGPQPANSHASRSRAILASEGEWGHGKKAAAIRQGRVSLPTV